jgi:tetratricopeptide (TPR) repeat protein
MFERRLVEAESELLRARSEQPALASASVRLTMLYAAMGRLDDALRALEEANAADPLLPVLPAAEINVRFCRREFDAAIACGKKALELHPYLQLVRVFYAQALEYAGHIEEALSQYGHAVIICTDLPWLRALKGACLARSGRRPEAEAIGAELEQTRATEYVDAYYMALLRDALGQQDEAFRELARACEEGSTALPILGVDPKMDALREDPRFARIAALAGPQSFAA